MSGETELERLVVRLMGDGTGYSSMLQGAVKDTQAAERSILDAGSRIESVKKTLMGIGQSIKGFGAGLRSYGMMMSAGITAPLSAIAGLSTRELVNYESQAQRLVSLVGLSQEEVKGLSEEFAAMAPVLGVSATELVATYEKVSSGGLRGKDAMEAMTAAAKASAIGMGDAETVGLAASLAMTAYGSANLKATEAVEMLRSAAEAGNAEASEFAPVLGQILPLADNMGIEFYETAGAIAQMTRTTGNASIATTRLAALLRKLQINVEGEKKLGKGSLLELQKVFKDEGIVKGIEFMEKKVAKAGLTMTEFLRDAEAVGGYQMLSKDINVLGEIIGDVKNSSGELDKMFKAWEETSGAKLAKSWVTIRGVMKDIGVIVTPVVEKITGWTAMLVTAWKNMPPQVKEMTVWILAGVAAIGPILGILGMAIGMVGSLVTAFASLFTIGGAIAAVVVTIGAALGGIALTSLGKDGIVGLWEKAKAGAQNLFVMVQGFLANFDANLKIIQNWFASLWPAIVARAGSALKTFAGNMLSNLLVVLETQRRVLIYMVGFLSGQLYRLFTQYLPDLFTWGMEKIMTIAPRFFKILKKMLHDAMMPGVSVGGRTKEIADAVKKSLSGAGSDFSKGFDEEMSKAIPAVAGILAEQRDKLKTPLEGFEGFGIELPELKLDLTNPMTKELKAVKGLMTDFWGFVTGVADKAWTDVTSGIMKTGEKATETARKGVRLPVRYEKIDALAAGSAEAAVEYYKYSMGKLGEPGMRPGPATGAARDTKEQGFWEDSLGYLKTIAGAVVNQSKKAGEVIGIASANLQGGGS